MFEKIKVLFVTITALSLSCSTGTNQAPNGLVKTKLPSEKELKIGDKIYDFKAYDPAGKEHLLSSYTGKYVLLNISSIHCGPCIESADEMRMLTKKYKEKLNVVTLSADNQTDWLKGIKDEKVTWVTLNDGQGLRGKTMLIYYTPGMRGFFIISPDGIIRASWSGYEKPNKGSGKLEQRLIKYLKKV